MPRNGDMSWEGPSRAGGSWGYSRSWASVVAELSSVVVPWSCCLVAPSIGAEGMGVRGCEVFCFYQK